MEVPEIGGALSSYYESSPVLLDVMHLRSAVR